MRTDDLVVGGVLLVIGGFVLLLVVSIIASLGTYFSGAYSYEYRCTDEVVEKRLHIWWGMPVAGFEPIDGDPVGTCE